MDASPKGRTAEQHGSADEGMRCPRCAYNLTGLPAPRCPECGTEFDWAVVRQAAANPPQIAFERACGWRKLPALALTWATVVFAPWVFARQAVRRIDTQHALAFGVVCFASTLVSLPRGAKHEFLAAWLLTAAICILAQALLLGIVDVSGWRAPFRSLHFWLLIGCYTSAVMATEFIGGPPPASTGDLWNFVHDGGWAHGGLSPWGIPTAREIVWWAQIVVWLAGLVCCYWARMRRATRSKVMLLPEILIVAAALLWLYASLVEHVGPRLYDWLN